MKMLKDLAASLNRIKLEAEENGNIEADIEDSQTVDELNALIDTYSNSTEKANLETIAPFAQFLKNRWQRMQACKPQKGYSNRDIALNKICIRLADSLSGIANQKNYSKDNSPHNFLKPRIENVMQAKKQAPSNEPFYFEPPKFTIKKQAEIEKQDDLVAELLKFKNESWKDCFKSIENEKLIDILLNGEEIKIETKKDPYAVYYAILEKSKFSTENERENKARFFCIAEMYERIRKDEPQYTTYKGKLFGYPKKERLDEIDMYQKFYASTTPLHQIANVITRPSKMTQDRLSTLYRKTEEVGSLTKKELTQESRPWFGLGN